MAALRSLPRNLVLDNKGISTLARTMYRQMRQNGYSHPEIIDFSSQMIELVRAQWQSEARPTPL